MIFVFCKSNQLIMKQKFYIVFLLFLFTQAFFAQDSLSVKLHPAQKYPWSVLYQLKDVKQLYINNKQQNKDSVFVYDMAQLTPGMYLLMYDMDSQNFVYFIYNHEPVQLDVYPKQHNKILIRKSKENKVFLPYAGKHNLLVSKLNKIEGKLAAGNLSVHDKQTFKLLKKNLDSLQLKYLKKSTGLLANKYIKNMAEYYPDINKPAKAYFTDKLQNYFSHVNFNDADLKRSNILIDKINTYVFNINPPKNPKTKHLEYLKRIENILPRIKDSVYKNNVIFSLTTSFVNVDGRVSKTLIDKYIKKMPAEEQQKINLQSVLDQIGLTIGEKAPDFNFNDLKGHQYNLYKITPKKPYTLLIFWSATCPHCLHAMPKIQKMFKDRDNFNIVAIGLETEHYPWSSEHQYYPEFIHGIKLEKWNNPIIKTYGIHATPTFFILNDKNEIIAEPYEVKDIQEFLDNLYDKK